MEITGGADLPNIQQLLGARWSEGTAVILVRTQLHGVEYTGISLSGVYLLVYLSSPVTKFLWGPR